MEQIRKPVKLALQPLNEGSHEATGSGEGLINRRGNAIWGTEGQGEKEKRKKLNWKKIIEGNFINNKEGK